MRLWGISLILMHSKARCMLVLDVSVFPRETELTSGDQSSQSFLLSSAGDAVLTYFLFVDLRAALGRLLAASPACACSQVSQSRDLLMAVKNEVRRWTLF